MKQTLEQQIGHAAYLAMKVEPDYVRLASLLMKAGKRERAKLLDTTPKEQLELALGYLAQPELTRERDRWMAWMREDRRRIAALKYYYSDPAHYADFICDWGVTSDPRAIAEGRFSLMPFHLWKKQRELVKWAIGLWRSGKQGCVVKGRDVGASWIAMALLCTMSVFERNFAGGIASATEVKLDRSGDPDTLLYKAREFVRHLPVEFRAGYDETKHSHYLRLFFPETGSTITGEAGANTGRGGRKSLVVVDEAAFFENPKAIDAALAATTNCRIDISTPNGINAFFERAHNQAIERFDITWRDDPRKNQAWYDKKKAEMDPVVFAQEIDANFYASAEGVLIPPQWASAAVGLAKRLGLEPTGAKRGALDVADVGKDRCAFAGTHGFELRALTSWSGKDIDTHSSTAKAFTLCTLYGVEDLIYDATGVGSAVRGAARVLNEARIEAKEEPIRISEFVAAGKPVFPERLVPGTNRKAKDMFLNRAAQAGWMLRLRFLEAYRAVNGEPYNPEHIISIDPDLPELSRLMAELSQPIVKETATGKLMLEKTPKGARSPNLFDVVSYAFAPRIMPLVISDQTLQRLLAATSGSSAMPTDEGFSE